MAQAFCLFALAFGLIVLAGGGAEPFHLILAAIGASLCVLAAFAFGALRGKTGALGGIAAAVALVFVLPLRALQAVRAAFAADPPGAGGLARIPLPQSQAAQLRALASMAAAPGILPLAADQTTMLVHLAPSMNGEALARRAAEASRP